MPEASKRKRLRFLVTAGNTRESIDSVRDWGNVFTGNTGLAIARALSEVGDVELLTSNVEHLDLIRRESEPKLTGAGFRSHADLKALLSRRFVNPAVTPDAVFMTAAISDFKPVASYQVTAREQLQDGTERWTVRNVQAPKVKSSFAEIAVLGGRTEKLVDLFRHAWGFSGLLVKFKLEVGLTAAQLLEVAHGSRLASNADYVVANTLDMVVGEPTEHAGESAGGFGPGAYLVGDDTVEWVPRQSLAARLARLACDEVESRSADRGADRGADHGADGASKFVIG